MSTNESWSLGLHEYITLMSFYKNSYSDTLIIDSYIRITCEASVDRGSYIGQVTSTSSSTYPSDGYQSSGTGSRYYYVFVG